MSVVDFLCIKWGTKYSYKDVNNLYYGVKRNMNIPFRFVCFTDDTHNIKDEVETYSLPDDLIDKDFIDTKRGGETWRKISLFKKNSIFKDDVLYLDLDIVIMDNLEELFSYKPGKFVVIQDWLEKFRGKIYFWRDGLVGNTSVFRFNLSQHNRVYDYFIDNQYSVLSKFRIEQQYVSWILKEDMEFWNPDWVKSYKRSCKPTFPLNNFISPKEIETKILVFHGNPLISDAINGYRRCNIFKRILPAKWLSKYYN